MYFSVVDMLPKGYIDIMLNSTTIIPILYARWLTRSTSKVKLHVIIALEDAQLRNIFFR
jgi:hypothetical protein